MFYHFKIHKEQTGYSAACVELSGCITQGESITELWQNMEEALNLYLAEPPDSTLVFPSPKKNLSGKNIATIEVAPEVYLAMSLRQERLKLGLTQKQMMTRLGIKNLSNYQRLEDPERANPELKTLVALKKAIPSLNLSPLFDLIPEKIKAS